MSGSLLTAGTAAKKQLDESRAPPQGLLDLDELSEALIQKNLPCGKQASFQNQKLVE